MSKKKKKKPLTLSRMFKRIQAYQEILSGDTDDMTPAERINKARECCLALYQEVSELTDSFPWKPWREVEDQVMDIANLEREVIDCIFFLAQITRCFNITPADLEDRFEKVLENNKLRLTNGYSKVTTNVKDGKNVEELL